MHLVTRPLVFRALLLTESFKCFYYKVDLISKGRENVGSVSISKNQLQVFFSGLADVLCRKFLCFCTI